MILNEQLQHRNTDLRRLTEDLNNVLSGTNIPILILDSDLRIHRFTPSAEPLLHLVAGDVGRPFDDLRTGIDIPQLDGLISKVMAGSREERRELQTSDGRWYSLRIRPFLNTEGKVDGVLLAFVDVGELKQAQEKVRQEQLLLKGILDAAQDLLVMVVDGNGHIVQFNQSSQKTSGHSLEEAVGQPVWDFLPVPEERSQVKATFEQILQGSVTQGENHLLTKTGQRRLISWSINVVRGDGKPDYVICTGVDVTDREEAQEQARESGAAARALLEAAPQAVLAHDRNGRIVLVNAAAEMLFGYKRQEMIGQSVQMLFPQNFRQQHLKNVDLFALRKDGSEFPVAVGLSHFETRNGTIGVSFVTDVTERRNNEAMLVQYHKELQALTGRLLHLQEAGNKELARELHDDLSQKLAALGMEVSTLLRPTRESAPALPQRVRALSAQINALADDVHALSRRLHPALLDELGLKVAIREECVGFSAQTGIPAEFNARGPLSRIPEDVSLCLYRVAQESLRNIAKHSRATNVGMRLSSRKGSLTLRIEDTGDGFDLTGVKSKGGLGLISMEERVRLVGGTFHIQSKPGAGTTVEVIVPLKIK